MLSLSMDNLSYIIQYIIVFHFFCDFFMNIIHFVIFLNFIFSEFLCLRGYIIDYFVISSLFSILSIDIFFFIRYNKDIKKKETPSEKNP